MVNWMIALVLLVIIGVILLKLLRSAVKLTFKCAMLVVLGIVAYYALKVL